MAIKPIPRDIMEQQWQVFFKSCYAHLDPIEDAAQIRECRMLFFTGAFCLLNVLKAPETFDPGLAETDRDLALMESIDTELTAAAVQYMNARGVLS